MRWFSNKKNVSNIAMRPSSTDIPMSRSCQLVKIKLENSADPIPQKRINCCNIAFVSIA